MRRVKGVKQAVHVYRARLLDGGIMSTLQQVIAAFTAAGYTITEENGTYTAAHSNWCAYQFRSTDQFWARYASLADDEIDGVGEGYAELIADIE